MYLISRERPNSREEKKGCNAEGVEELFAFVRYSHEKGDEKMG